MGLSNLYNLKQIKPVNKLAKKNLWATTAIILAAVIMPSVLATDRAPTYDYANGNYNLSCFNSPTYNTTTRSYNFLPAGNQYCNLANNLTAALPSNTSSWYFAGWYTLARPAGTGQAYTMALLKGFNFTANTGYNLRLDYNGSNCMRNQVIYGGNFATGSYMCTIANDAWFFAENWFNGSHCFGAINLNTTLNTTCTGVAASTGAAATWPDKLFGEGTAGGTANGMWNGTGKYIVGFNNTPSVAQRTSLYNNQTTSLANNLFNFTFENTTSATINVSTTFVRTLNPDFIGFHSALSPCANETWVDTDGDGTAETLANYTQCQSLLNATGNKQLRLVSELWNICAYENGTSGTCVYNYTNTSNNNYKNFRSQVSLVAFAALTNSTLKVNINSVPRWLATNNSECNYGLSGGSIDGSVQEDCDAASYSSTRGYGSVVGRYLIDLGCFSYGKHVCDVEGDNEPYLPQFYLPNTTAVPVVGSCTLRTTRINSHYNSTFVNTKAYLTTTGVNQSLVRWVSPSYTTSGISSCAEAAGTNFSITFPRLGSNSPDLMNWHPYDSNANMGLCTEFNTIENIMSTNGWDGYYVNTESEWNNPAVSNASDQSEKTAGLGKALTCLVQNTTVDSHLWYKLASITTAEEETENYFGFRPSVIQSPMLVRGSILMNNITQSVQKGGSVYSCNSNNSNVNCAFIKHNSTYGLVIVSNLQNNQLDIDNISIAGNTIGSVTRYSTNTTETVSGGVIDPSYLKYYGVELYQVTFNATNISATYNPSTYIVNITEPENQTFSVNLTNPSNQTYNIVWQNTTGGSPITACANQTTCTFIGSYTSAGQYNWTVTITGETNTLTKVWLLQVNQTTAPISFATTSPSSPVSITSGDSQLFSYTLSNINNLSTLPTWSIDGVNQTTCYNATSCLVTTTNLTQGTFTVRVNVTSSVNNLTNVWTLNVNPDTDFCGTEGVNGVLGYIGTFFVIITFIGLLGMMAGGLLENNLTGIAMLAVLGLILLILVVVIGCV